MNLFNTEEFEVDFNCQAYGSGLRGRKPEINHELEL